MTKPLLSQGEASESVPPFKPILLQAHTPISFQPYPVSALFPLLQLPNLPQPLQQQIIIYNHLMLTIRADQVG